MRVLASTVVLILWGFAIAAAAAPAASVAAPSAEERDYKLGVGDVVRVEVHNEPDLTIESSIPETANIDYPFLGSIRAAGLTVGQLQERITKGLLGDYLVKPEVSVRVIRYRPFYVRGQVRNSGGFPYVQGLTVEKAVTVAGGFTDRASLRNMFLIRENTTQEQKIKVNLDSPVSPGDTIIVEESLF